MGIKLVKCMIVVMPIRVFALIIEDGVSSFQL